MAAAGGKEKRHLDRPQAPNSAGAPARLLGVPLIKPTQRTLEGYPKGAAQLTEEGGRGGRGSRARGFLLRLTMPGSLHCAQWVRLRCPACPKLGTAFPHAHRRDTTLTIPGCMAGGGQLSQQQQLCQPCSGAEYRHNTPLTMAGCRADEGPVSKQAQQW